MSAETDKTFLIEENKKLKEEVVLLEDKIEAIFDETEETTKDFYQRSLSIVGLDNVTKVVDALTVSGYDVLVTTDSYQRVAYPADKRAYTVHYLHREYEGLRILVQED